MARGNMIGVKGSNLRRIQQRGQDSEESDEEYNVAEDEDCDESDEYYSLDGEESEEILADFEVSRRVVRSRNTRRTSSGRKRDVMKKPRKKRRVCYTKDEDDDVEEDKDEEEELDDEDDAEFVSFGTNTDHIKKPREKKRVTYIEVDDNEEEDHEEYLSSGRKKNQRKKPHERKRASYTEEKDEEEEEEEEEEEDEDEDATYMHSGRNVNQKKRLREKTKVSYMEDDDDEDDSEFISTSSKGNQIKETREKKKVSYTEDEEDDYEFWSTSRKGNQIKETREKRKVSYTEDDEDDYEFRSSSRKGNQIKETREKRKVSYTEDDEDDYEFRSSSRKGNRIKETREKRKVSYTEDDEDDYDFGSTTRKGNQVKETREKRKISYTEDDEDDNEFGSTSRKGNQKKETRENRKISYTEDDEDDYEFMSTRRKGNQRKETREKRKVSYTEDDEDDYEFGSTSRKGNQVKETREKRKISYTEDDEDDYEFRCTSRKGKIKETREERMVSDEEDNQEEEDENDAEFMLSESDFVDEEDESPKMKKNEKVCRYPPQKKSVGRGLKKSKKSKIKKPTRPKQRGPRFCGKSGSSKERPVRNENQVEKRSRKTSGRQKQRVVAESDSDFVSSASLDHEYTISEEEREQMREARIYCANLRAKLRSSTCGEDAQRKNPVRKGKEKVEAMKDEVGKQVCGICLSEEGERTVRGVLNCCRHYFCFSCIMEWSKVESRCPLCKQRFGTIAKAAKSETGFDSRTVVIPVPECDQVYEPSEEELRGYLDPYESVICTECHHGGDDALMLLCDVCDSPAHTFCVGLGREVPEGNWYCEGCRPTVFGSLNSQRQTPISDRSVSSQTGGGFDLNELYVPETPLTQQTRILPEPRPPVADFPAGTVATTLRDRRRIYRQMHHRFRNNNDNRMSDFGRSSASSSGIRLFGSQLDEAREWERERPREDHTSFLSPRADPVENSSLQGMGMGMGLGFAQLRPCTNR